MKQLDSLLAWYTTLTPESVALVASYYDIGAHFKDPFNDVRGIASIQAIFTHMFASTEHPRFVIAEKIIDGQQAFVTWRFEFSLRGKAYDVVGASHLKFGTDGRVVEHRDYWDAAEELFQKLPVVGGPIGWLRRRFSATRQGMRD
jgi:hypothetical protein